MRVSIVNPRSRKSKKKSSGKKRKMSAKQRKAAVRNLKKARAAKKRKSSGKNRSHAKKSHKGKGKKKSKKGKKRKSRKGKKRKSRKGKKRKHRRAKGMPKGKRVRPAMYISRKGGRKTIRHSPKSRYARRGYRFNPNPIGKYVPASWRRHIISMDGGKITVPTIAGGVVGLVVSGYAGGKMREIGSRVSGGNQLVSTATSLAGNVLGTEFSSMAVHVVMTKLKLKSADNVAKGMRIGGYLALGFNAASSVLKILGVNVVAERMLSAGAPASQVILSGLGDWDLTLGGLGENLIQGLGNTFESTADYAGLLSGDEGLLDAELNALSNYLGEDLDEFPGGVSSLTNDQGNSP